ncbi:hypothetical protein Csa_000931 [Cucumis sativus]|uniref:Uncharacterized protein n=1 Tax=Cucumis sativus TaxID=3659 RepID=A0A0A0LHC1_CUCSA|nr:hypothetical protein Csa_000931 [Cucumis sativus]
MDLDYIDVHEQLMSIATFDSVLASTTLYCVSTRPNNNNLEEEVKSNGLAFCSTFKCIIQSQVQNEFLQSLHSIYKCPLKTLNPQNKVCLSPRQTSAHACETGPYIRVSPKILMEKLCSASHFLYS